MNGLSIDLVGGAPPVLNVHGDLDMSNADEFGAELKEAIAAHPRVVVDLAGLTFIDAAGLRAILRIAESRDGQEPLTLVHAARVTWILDAAGLDDLPGIDFGSGGDGLDG